jgi:hypothetical protein
MMEGKTLDAPSSFSFTVSTLAVQGNILQYPPVKSISSSGLTWFSFHGDDGFFLKQIY